MKSNNFESKCFGRPPEPIVLKRWHEKEWESEVYQKQKVMKRIHTNLYYAHTNQLCTVAHKGHSKIKLKVIKIKIIATSYINVYSKNYKFAEK